MKNEELVGRIVECTGGKENLCRATNCMTRLRLEVRSDDAVQLEQLKKLDGVLGVVFDREHALEIVLGPGRCKKCADICAQMGIGDSPKAAPAAADAVSVTAVPERRCVTHGETILCAFSEDENSYVIRDEAGIHARPAGALVNLAKQFDAQVYLTANGRTARADSILEIMSLGAARGTKVTLRAEGAQAEEALRAVKKLMEDTL